MIAAVADTHGVRLYHGDPGIGGPETAAAAIAPGGVFS
jgi:hypothetical protein